MSIAENFAQLSSAADLGNVARMIQANPEARITLCGSLSLHVSPLGAAMHLAGYRALGLAFTYVPFAVTDVAGAITGMRALGVRGFGISMPYKQTVMPLIDTLDPVAAAIGAVNTVVNDGGHLTGYNTDAAGAVRAFEEIRPLAGARVLLLGAGGAAKAIAHGFTERGARVTIANRDRARAAALAAATGARAAAGLDEANRAGNYDAVVNATAIGMADLAGKSPIPESALHPGLLVMDIVYKPIETELVRAAQRKGATVIHGGRMLLHQAARQFELYTGHDAPLAAMETALLAQIGATIPSP
jgi:shikimate dehydrogenase